MTSIREPGQLRRNYFYTAVGVTGELLITAGIFLLAFLVWQLWWTDVLGNQAQAAAIKELDFTPAPAPSGTGPLLATPRYDDPPILVEPPFASTFATLQVPRWVGEPERPISEGTDKAQVLDVLGIGHYEGSAMPGQIGNFAVAAHRTTYAKPFNRIAELQVGDALIVRTADTWYVYTVTTTQIVSPQAVDVLAPVPGDPAQAPVERFITLTTCHPMYSASERYVVHGVLSYWAPTSSGIPAELLEG